MIKRKYWALEALYVNGKKVTGNNNTKYLQVGHWQSYIDLSIFFFFFLAAISDRNNKSKLLLWGRFFFSCSISCDILNAHDMICQRESYSHYLVQVRSQCLYCTRRSVLFLWMGVLYILCLYLCFTNNTVYIYLKVVLFYLFYWLMSPYIIMCRTAIHAHICLTEYLFIIIHSADLLLIQTRDGNFSRFNCSFIVC